MDFRDFSPPIKYGAKLNNTSLVATKVWLGDSNGLAQETAISGAFTLSNAGVATLGQGAAFIATATVGTITSAGTVEILADSVVTGISSTAKVYVEGFIIQNSSVLWETSTGTGFILQDSTGTALANYGISAGTSNFGASDIAFLTSEGSIVLNTPITLGTGGNAGAGIVFGATPSGGTAALGQYMDVTVWGIIK